MFGGPERGDGFAELAEFDSNGDNVVDGNDARFSDLLLWQDSNVDGVTDAGELQNAGAAGLSFVRTDFRSQDVFESGNLLGEVSRAGFRGQEVDAVDIYFRFDQLGATSQATPDPAIAQLLSSMSAFSAPASTGLVPPTIEDTPYVGMTAFVGAAATS